jgi:hypothetical protein
MSFIFALRGDKFPRQCDWCQTMLTEDTAIPISGGEWVCAPCLGIILSGEIIKRLDKPRS